MFPDINNFMQRRFNVKSKNYKYALKDHDEETNTPKYLNWDTHRKISCHLYNTTRYDTI